MPEATVAQMPADHAGDHAHGEDGERFERLRGGFVEDHEERRSQSHPGEDVARHFGDADLSSEKPGRVAHHEKDGEGEDRIVRAKGFHSAFRSDLSYGMREFAL